MQHKLLILGVFTVGLLFSGQSLIAAEQPQQKVQGQTKSPERIFGSQLMTEKERAEYRERMRAAKTPEDREKLRKEHHDRMVARAKERGVTIPDEPPVKGGGMGPGKVMGTGPGGMGPDGMGKGGAPGR
jgi:hypothetical protein